MSGVYDNTELVYPQMQSLVGFYVVVVHVFTIQIQQLTHLLVLSQFMPIVMKGLTELAWLVLAW